jgi:hypothetical protein
LEVAIGGCYWRLLLEVAIGGCYCEGCYCEGIGLHRTLYSGASLLYKVVRTAKLHLDLNVSSRHS